MAPKYSGKKSQSFWRRINAIPKKVGTRLYALGCDLQDLEGEVLAFLEEVEKGKTKKSVLEEKLRAASEVRRRQVRY